GIYGAEFVPGDASTQSFILGGFPFNGLGLVDDVAGFYPSLLDGPSGNGILAYILFRFLDGQEAEEPNFRIDNAAVLQPVPQPGALTLVAAALVALRVVPRRFRRR